jgi:hypothetical protein
MLSDAGRLFQPVTRSGLHHTKVNCKRLDWNWNKIYGEDESTPHGGHFPLLLVRIWAEGQQKYGIWNGYFVLG